MFNDLVVSNSVRGQLPEYIQTDYPNFVNFIKDYYRFLETNSNPLDLLNSTQKLVDVDTYTGIDYRARLKTPVAQNATEIVVLDHVEFPKTDGLLRINDEIIFYKTREHIADEFNAYKLTVFSGCIRGYTANELDIDNGFTPNIKTTPALHSATSVVYNQSYTYLLYFLEKLRSQYLVDFPKNILEKNINSVNFNVLLKRIKDFYLTKGTPNGIEFYFKFLFQKSPELINYSDYLMASSDAIYQSKKVVKVEALDVYNTQDLISDSFTQLGREYPIQTVENVFTLSSQIYEIELSDSENIKPTYFTIVTSRILNNKLYVDSTYGFLNSGYIRIGDNLLKYSSKETNYFILDELPQFYNLGDRVYDVNTLTQVKSRPDIYFAIYAGITGFDITKNYTYYQKNDIGYVSDIILEDSLLVNGWQFNDQLPVIIKNEFVAGVSSVYTDDESVYIYTSGIPYYDVNPDLNYLTDNNIILSDSKYLKRIPKIFTKSPEGFKESTIQNQPVGFLRDGTPILNWKSNINIIRGSLQSVGVLFAGNNYNVSNPPRIAFDAPRNALGTTAEGELIVNGGIKEVYVVNGGNGYPQNTVISVIKDPTDTKYSGDQFSPAVLRPIIVKGKIAKVRILDPGKGYTKQPTIEISPRYTITEEELPVGTQTPYKAILDLFVAGPVEQVRITNRGSHYDADPGYQFELGGGASGILTVENGKITGAQVVNAGNGYNSAPLVRVVDTTGAGGGAVIISEIDQSGTVIDFIVINPGINYSEFGTVMEVFESGSGLVLDTNIASWNLINNWDIINVDPYYESTNGGYLFGQNIIQDPERGNPKFESIPFKYFTTSEPYSYFDADKNITVNSRRLLYYIDGYEDGKIAANQDPSQGVRLDQLSINGLDLIDEGTVTIQAPFNIVLGSTSTNPSGVATGGDININANGFITFGPLAPSNVITGWATEQLSPSSVGPSIQIGKDDLIIDQLYYAFVNYPDPNTPDEFVIRVEGYHFNRGFSRQNSVIYEVIFYNNITGRYDNDFKINIIENQYDDLDEKKIYITYSDDNQYEFEGKDAEPQTSYLYSTDILAATTPVFSKKFTIIGAPKRLELVEEGSPVVIDLNDATEHSPLIGWSLDGAPIYGPYGYENALDPGSTIIKMTSGWKRISASEHINNGNGIRTAPVTSGGLQNYPLGSFEEDYVWTEVGASLDTENGRYCVTPEFPNGVYAYFMTVDFTNKRNGFPYFVGSKFSGKTYSDFNSLELVAIEDLNGVRRYISPYSTAVPKPIDTGRFIVESVPTSSEASVDSVNIVTSGSGYKVGDVIVVNNADTEGEGAAGYVSVIKGRPISSVSYNYYDYLEYYDENIPFVQGSTIKTLNGFSATVHSVDQINKNMYLSNVLGQLPSIKEQIYDTNLTVDLTVSSELVGPDISTIAVNLLPTTAQLSTDIDSVTSYFLLSNFTNCTISDFYSPSTKRYIKIGQEFMRVLQISGNYVLVERGYNTVQTTHSAGSTVTLLTTIDIFDSSQFIVGDIVKVDDEVFRVVDIQVEKQYEVVSTKIVNGTGTSGGIFYYLYVNGQLQENSNADPGLTFAQDVVKLNVNGDIDDLTFDTNVYTYEANPVAEILTSTTYNPNNVVPNTEILATTFVHRLIVERAAFDTSLEIHYPRTPIYRLRYVNARVGKYEEDRILARINVQNSLLVQNDPITVIANTENDYEYNIAYTNEILTGLLSPITLYERSSYRFSIDPSSNISVSFFTPSDDITKQKEYFDVNISRIYSVSGRLEEFTLYPDSSDLTELIMRISSLDDNTFIDVTVKIYPEPINGNFTVVNSNTSFVEFFINRDPLTFLTTQYSSNNIRYITTSKNSNGGIESVTLTSGGFNYKTVPQISNIKTANGQGAILEALSDSIGRIKSISSINSGYGYSPDPTLKPSLVFPKIAKLSRNFIVTDLVINNTGEGYLFTPRINVTGGGLGDGDTKHAVLLPIIQNERLVGMNIDYEGVQYSSAPIIQVEKFYYTTINSNGELSFKFNFKRYLQDNDAFKIRAYYIQNNQTQYIDSSITFYVYLGVATVSCRSLPATSNFVNPLNYITLPFGTSAEYYEIILNERRAEVTAIVDKSTFNEGEKVIINGNKNYFGFVSRSKGWQPNNSIIRLENLNYEITESDTILGVDSNAFGFVDTTFGVESNATLGSLIETQKQFLNTNSFLGLNALKLQDSFRYQKYAYEIGTEVPFVEWKENYQNAAHPAGHNVFAKTNIATKIGTTIKGSTNVNVSTDISSIVRLNQRYNYLIAKNQGIDEVSVINRLLTDVKNLNSSVVAAFEDISDQFNGVETSFELRVVDPVTPVDDNDNVNYIEDYEIDQMVVILDNIIQTYGTSWTVTDSDKTLSFETVRDAGEVMPQGELMTYRQFNEDTTIYSFNVISTTATDTFTLIQQDLTQFPSSVFSPVETDKWIVFVDGVHQQSSSYTITSNTITFTEVLPLGTQISVRYVTNLLNNEFTSGSVTAGTPFVLTNVPTTTSKESYFVFVDGILISTDDYSLDANNDIIFTYNITYNSLSVVIDPLGVSLETSTHNIISNQFVYKIEDGQIDIPVGYTISPADYIVDISGVCQTPYVSYSTTTSGVRKINFTEPPQKYIDPDRIVGRQFVGLLYQRQDATGALGTTPNYQFDDISKNIINVKESLNDFVIGDYVVTANTSAKIVDAVDEVQRKIIDTGFSGTVTSNATFTIILSDIINLYVGDRVLFNAAFGMTSADDNELEISAINKLTKTVTLQNISGSSLLLTIDSQTSIRFHRRAFIVEELETTVLDRDNAFASLDTLESGIISSEETGISTNLNEPYGVLVDDTEITVDDASIFSINDYISIDSTEIVKITNIVGNILTISRSQLKTEASRPYGDGTTVELITPKTITVSSFIRGFDGNKTDFILRENGEPVYIRANRDIFVIVNGILQKRGSAYNLVEVDLDGNPNSGDEYSEIRFTEPPADGTPFNCFYVGELISIENIQGQFNGAQVGFDLRSVTGEIFSLISNNRPEANVSANLIMFIDGVYQIPSTTEVGRLEAYSESLASFKLLGSIIEFSSPPKNGSEFEGYIYVGSEDDYESIDIDATVEADDIIVQYNEIAPRRILSITSATKMSVTQSQGELVTANPSGINLGESGTGWWKADIIKSARIRESLRLRRTLFSEIVGFGGSSPYPLSGKVLYTTALSTIEIANISSDLPQSPDDNSNQISFILPATANFDSRVINSIYTTFVARNQSVPGDLDEIQGVIVGYDLPFDQIVKLDSNSIGESFEDEYLGQLITYNGTKTARLINWDPAKQFVYLKLDDPSTPMTTSNIIKSYNIIQDDLINEYQTLDISGDPIKVVYNF